MTQTLVLVLILSASAAFAQNPCTDPPPSGVVIVGPPTLLHADIAEFATLEIDGSPRITDFLYGYFAEGADPATATPIQGPSTLPKAAFALVAGTCYGTGVPAPIPTGQRLVAALRAHRASSATMAEAFSPWSTTSNPFGTAPAVLMSLGRPVVK